MSSFAVLFDPDAGSWLRLSDPLEEVEVHEPDKVMQALDYIERRVEAENLYAAGFVSYEAAPAFDDALHTHPPDDFPLLRFGLFAGASHLDLPAPEPLPQNINWLAEEDAETFAGKVDNIRAAIARGETYQVNLTFSLTGEYSQDPWQLFLHLVHGQQPDNCGFLQSDRWAICSASPELFFARNGSKMTMRPMKGTAPRGRFLKEDQQLATDLQGSAKNRAENVMILDMIRNDLGRLAPPGEVRTDAICSLEKYPTVWQLTSTASARSDASLTETFRALFPCASITGAPKAKTMQIIMQTECHPRHIYTGAFGWVAPNRRCHFNVAIRTIVIERHTNISSYGVGAGITWDSDGREEYQECLDKAAVLSSPKNDFSLIETLRWTPGKGFFLLPEHIARLQASAEYFDFTFVECDITAYLEELAKTLPPSPQRVRLLLHHDGGLEAAFLPLEAGSGEPAKVCFADVAVNSNDSRLFHKTTQRDFYERCLNNADNVDEVILWNEHGEVTECCTANLVFEKDGKLLTPPLACGLLPGTYRDYLLRKGVISEGVITREDLQSCSAVYLVNAVRKWRRAELIK